MALSIDEDGRMRCGRSHVAMCRRTYTEEYRRAAHVRIHMYARIQFGTGILSLHNPPTPRNSCLPLCVFVFCLCVRCGPISSTCVYTGGCTGSMWLLVAGRPHAFLTGPEKERAQCTRCCAERSCSQADLGGRQIGLTRRFLRGSLIVICTCVHVVVCICEQIYWMR